MNLQVDLAQFFADTTALLFIETPKVVLRRRLSRNFLPDNRDFISTGDDFVISLRSSSIT